MSITKNFIPNAVRKLFFNSYTSIKNSMSGFPKLITIITGFKLGFGNFLSGVMTVTYTTSLPSLSTASVLDFNPFTLIPEITRIQSSKNFYVKIPLTADIVKALHLTNNQRVELSFVNLSEVAHKILLMPKACTYSSTLVALTFLVEVLDLNTVALTDFDISFSVSLSKISE
jgi:hypothetical protein